VSSHDLWLLVAAGTAIVVAAGFAAVETAISRVSRVVAEDLAREGRSGAKALLAVLRDSARYLGPLLLVRVIAEVFATAAVAVVIVDEVGGGWRSVGITLLVMTVLTFVVVEVGPRTLGRQQSEPFALRTAGAVRGLARLTGPLPRLLVMVGNALTPGRGFRDGPFASEAELRGLVEAAERSGVVDRTEASMISGVFELGETLAREVMVPRPDMVVIEAGKTVRQALTLALRSGFSRIPVVGDSTDDVIGLVHVKELTRRVLDSRTRKDLPVEEVAKPATFVPESKTADQLLREMQASRTHMVIVVDEYGGTAGLVTIEDILEEIVGEITDEYDDEIAPIEELPDGRLRVTARLLVEELADCFDIEIPHDEGVETVGGLLAAELGRVPIPGATVQVGQLRLTAESAAGRRNRIGTVVVERIGQHDA
jgi:CBS domain containing-hemolysin-like protein